MSKPAEIKWIVVHALENVLVQPTKCISPMHLWLLHRSWPECGPCVCLLKEGKAVKLVQWHASMAFCHVSVDILKKLLHMNGIRDLEKTVGGDTSHETLALLLCQTLNKDWGSKELEQCLQRGSEEQMQDLGESLLRDVPKDVMLATLLKDDAEKACQFADNLQEKAKSKVACKSPSLASRVQQHVARTSASSTSSSSSGAAGSSQAAAATPKAASVPLSSSRTALVKPPAGWVAKVAAGDTSVVTKLRPPNTSVLVNSRK